MTESKEPNTPSAVDAEPAPSNEARIDALMALPPRPPPSIIVIGDDAVSAITLPPRRT
jgi:hypothetical protein